MRRRTDPRLPPALETGDHAAPDRLWRRRPATVDAIADELAKDRQVQRLDDGAVEARTITASP